MSSKRQIKWREITGENLNLSYAHHFIESDRATEILDTLERELTYFSGDLAKVKVFGKWRDIPRQQVAFGDPGLSYKFSGLSIPSLTWPAVLEELRNEINEQLGHHYNFVLVNRYKDGKDHMGEHRDDERELDDEAGIASISLGQVRDFVLRHNDLRRKVRHIEPLKIQLGHGSLLHMKSPTNSFWYHSLPARKNLPGVRINLTFRKVIQEKVKTKSSKN